MIMQIYREIKDSGFESLQTSIYLSSIIKMKTAPIVLIVIVIVIFKINVQDLLFVIFTFNLIRM